MTFPLGSSSSWTKPSTRRASFAPPTEVRSAVDDEVAAVGSEHLPLVPREHRPAVVALRPEVERVLAGDGQEPDRLALVVRDQGPYCAPAGAAPVVENGARNM
jgi:hypothetical protein